MPSFSPIPSCSLSRSLARRELWLKKWHKCFINTQWCCSQSGSLCWCRTNWCLVTGRLARTPSLSEKPSQHCCQSWKIFHLSRSCQVEAGHKGAADQPERERQHYSGVTKPDQISCWNHPSFQIFCNMFIFLIVISHQVIVSNISSFASALALESPTRASSTKLWGKRVEIDEKSWAARSYNGSDGRPARRCL